MVGQMFTKPLPLGLSFGGFLLGDGIDTESADRFREGTGKRLVARGDRPPVCFITGE